MTFMRINYLFYLFTAQGPKTIFSSIQSRAAAVCRWLLLLALFAGVTHDINAQIPAGAMRTDSPVGVWRCVKGIGPYHHLVMVTVTVTKKAGVFQVIGEIADCEGEVLNRRQCNLLPGSVER